MELWIRWRTGFRQMLRIFYCNLVLLLWGAAIVGAGEWQPLGIFEGKGREAVWRSPRGPRTRTQSEAIAGHPGLRLMCPLTRVRKRCCWTTDITLDLSAITELQFAIRATQPTAISRASLHFRSGDGWYGGWFTVNERGHQIITLKRHAFTPEGNPTGWDAIDGVRISLWKGASRDTLVALGHLRGRCNDLVVIQNSHAIRTHPHKARSIERMANRMRQWLEDAGVPVGQLDDADITHGLPTGCAIALLPHNPHSPQTTITALQQFTARGGGLILAYTLPEPLAPILGLEGATWRKADTTAPFSAIRFTADREAGYPDRIQQDSWNANIPHPVDAEIVAYWQNGAGETSAVPAITVNTHGAFISHLLTPADHTAKVRCLLALATELRPDLKTMLAHTALQRAATLFSFDGWPATRAFIRKTAATHDRVERATVHLDAITKYQNQSEAALETASFGALLTRATVMRGMIQKAYVNAVSNHGVPHEFRGAWCHDAEGVTGLSWANSLAAMQRGGFNVLLANMLWAGKAYYPSKVLPEAPLVEQRGDMLAHCLKACREAAIELHVWKVCWNLLQAPESFVETMRKAGRLQQKADGSEVLWLCPSDPRNRKLECEALKEVVRNYDINGVHLDYIRYPDGDSCYCDGCRKRFSAATGAAADPWPEVVISGSQQAAFQTWRHETITSFVKAVHDAVKQIRPTVQVSAAVFPSWPSCRDTIGQDWATWAQHGYIDFLCPMNYVTDADAAVDLFMTQRKAIRQRVPLYPGLGPSAKSLAPEQVVHQMDRLRQAGARGFVLFELDRDLLNMHIPALRTGATAPTN